MEHQEIAVTHWDIHQHFFSSSFFLLMFASLRWIWFEYNDDGGWHQSSAALSSHRPSNDHKYLVISAVMYNYGRNQSRLCNKTKQESEIKEDWLLDTLDNIHVVACSQLGKGWMFACLQLTSPSNSQNLGRNQFGFVLIFETFYMHINLFSFLLCYKPWVTLMDLSSKSPFRKLCSMISRPPETYNILKLSSLYLGLVSDSSSHLSVK